MTLLRRGFASALVLLCFFCAACSGKSPSPAGSSDAGSADAGSPPDAGASGRNDASSASSSGGADAGASAVTQTIATNAHCTAIPDFYWEIGDASGVLASGSVGSGVAQDTRMAIASASKLVFGAYVVERFRSDMSSIDLNAMRMQGGYTSLVYDACLLSTSVQACFDAASNSTYKAAEVGRFYYNGGHFQKYAIDLGLGADDSAALATHIKALVGPELGFTFGSRQLAGGITASASDYAAFLRKILAGTLAIHDHLGENATCTEPGACATADYSPAPAAWHYSYAHWVEDDPAGDGAFSSPGAFGFYPWIDATKTYYGILARHVITGQAYIESAECGALLRKAFVTGVAQ
jgi:hypothetical protein